MSKLYYEALAKLPKAYRHDDTRTYEIPGKVIAANAKLPPICFREDDTVWRKLKYEYANKLNPKESRK